MFDVRLVAWRRGEGCGCVRWLSGLGEDLLGMGEGGRGRCPHLGTWEEEGRKKMRRKMKRKMAERLVEAARASDLDVVKELIDGGVDVDATDKYGRTALMYAAENGHLEVVRYLAEKCGVDVNATTKDGSTALMYAARDGHLELVRYLVDEHGADVNATDKNGWTALMLAAQNGHLEVVSYLVEECGVDVNATNKDGKSAIKFAADRGHQDIVRILSPFLMRSQPTTSESSSLNLPLCTIPPTQLALTQRVDTNNLGGEYLAKWLDADVIIKLFIPDAAHSSFEVEVQLWQQLRHPNVIKMYGACEIGPGLQFFVCEYADGGSLIEYVKLTPEDEPRTVWKYLYEAALGLEYLHERRLVHGDLRCSNVLIGSDGLVRLSNFGLSGVKSGASSTVGSMRWQAPEILKGKESSSPFASDVYSFGMCILEAVTGKKPWNGQDNVEAKRRKITWIPETEYLSWDAPECPYGDARDLVWRMCCQDPTKRIKIQYVVHELERLALKESLRHSQSEPEHEPVHTLDTYKLGEIKELWRKVEAHMKETSNAQYRQTFDELKPLYTYLHKSTHRITLLTRFHTLLTEFHTVITMNEQEILAMRLSSSQATSNSIYAFHRRIQSLWVVLGQPVDSNVTQTDAQRRELFVSGVSDVYMLLRELESDDEKVAFLEMLKREMTHQKVYTSTQLEVMKNAVEALESRIGVVEDSLVPEWFIPWYELIKHEDECLGVGGFGSVIRAKWLDSEVVVKQVDMGGSKGSLLWSNMSSMETISIEDVKTRSQAMESKETSLEELKKRPTKREEAMKMFRREVDIWFGFSHPHVIQLFGACHVGTPFFVCEYATNGTLVQYLRKHSGELWQKLYEAALGVQYLHARGVVHGDLKGNNIVVGSDMKAKVTDFGLSSIASDRGEARISAASHWVAPECFLADPLLTFASDVYSLGMCIVESMRVVGDEEWSLPWRDVDNVIVKAKARQGKLPPRPFHCTDDQWELVNRMCAFQPEKRIKISVVVDELASLAHDKTIQSKGHREVRDRELLAPGESDKYRQLRDVELDDKKTATTSATSTFESHRRGQTQQIWTEIVNRMKLCTNEQHHRVFNEFKLLYEGLGASPYPVSLLDQLHIILVDFHAGLFLTPDQALAMHISATRPIFMSVGTFHQRIDLLWQSLCKPSETRAEGQEQWDDQQQDAFMAGVSDLYHCLNKLQSDEERNEFINARKAEVESYHFKYSPDHVYMMKKTIEAVEKKHCGESSPIPDWFIPWYKLTVNEAVYLGEGGFGVVYQGRWVDSKVAVKMLKGGGKSTTRWQSFNVTKSAESSSDLRSPRPSDLAAFRREVDIWFTLKHPHLIQLYGACHVGKPFFVCELAANGTLAKYLGKHPDEMWEKLHEAALGVQYLHRHNVVHGDLKGDNIMIGGNFQAKVSDFGLSTHTNDTTNVPISAASHWVAPECFGDNAKASFESDIYSFGMCIVEAMRVVEAARTDDGTRFCFPWFNLANDVVRRFVKKGQLPQKPDIAKDDEWDLVERMCVLEPKKRIKISTVVDELARLASEKESIAVTAKSSSLEFVPDVVTASRALLTELHDNDGRKMSMYAGLWDELETVFSRIDDVQRSNKRLEEFRCLVKDAEAATLKLQVSKASLMESFETIMAVYPLRRRLTKFVEANFVDGL